VYATADEAFYDPNRDQIIGSDSQVWRFDFEIGTDDALAQEQGNIYWLGIHHSFDLDCSGSIFLPDVSILTNSEPFGWKTSPDHFVDDAVWTIVDTWPGEPIASCCVYVISADQKTKTAPGGFILSG